MKKRLTAGCILVAYGAVLIKVMVFKYLPVIRIDGMVFNFGGSHEGHTNLIPFKTIWPYLRGDKGLLIAAINIAGNIVLLVPAGLLVPFVFCNITWKKSLVLAVAAGLAIETMQLLLQVGIFDIDDVILNGLGVMIGYWAFTILVKMERSMKLKMLMIISVIIIAAAAACYGFIISRRHQAPAGFIPGAGNGQSDNFDKRKDEILPGKDPCRGTGGTGQIVSLERSSITIKRRDGVSEMINLTAKTIIKNSVGSLARSDLKIGDQVTVVVLANHIATAILVCNAANLQQQNK